MNSTPGPRRSLRSPRSAPASGPVSPQISEHSFKDGKRNREPLPYGTRLEPVGTRLEVDFTDFLYIGTVMRHSKHGGG